MSALTQVKVIMAGGRPSSSQEFEGMPAPGAVYCVGSRLKLRQIGYVIFGKNHDLMATVAHTMIPN